MNEKRLQKSLGDPIPFIIIDVGVYLCAFNLLFIHDAWDGKLNFTKFIREGDIVKEQRNTGIGVSKGRTSRHLLITMEEKCMKSCKATMKSLGMFFVMIVMVCILAVPSYAASINVKKATVGVKATYQLKVKGTNRKAKWTSSNKKVATVTSKGLVTAKKKGKATITATIGREKYKCTVTVKPNVCYFNPESVKLDS